MPLLNSTFLRRAAYPLRASNPKLYMALNRLRSSLLARGRDLDAYQSNAVDRFERRVRLRGKRVLEIGSDAEGKILRALAARGAGAVVGINSDRAVVRKAGARARDLQLVIASAADLPFPDASLDAVFSVATFEHILDLPRALVEMHRVLRPGGLVYTNFGPIWSGGKGHHVEAHFGDETALHMVPDKNPLPDFCHLLMTPDELHEALRGRVSDGMRRAIVMNVYDDPHTNRLFFHEYLELMHASPLRVDTVVPERDPVAPQLLRVLQFKFPRESAFDITNVEIVLVRDA